MGFLFTSLPLSLFFSNVRNDWRRIVVIRFSPPLPSADLGEGKRCLSHLLGYDFAKDVLVIIAGLLYGPEFAVHLWRLRVFGC